MGGREREWEGAREHGGLLTSSFVIKNRRERKKWMCIKMTEKRYRNFIPIFRSGLDILGREGGIEREENIYGLWEKKSRKRYYVCCFEK